MTLPHYWPSVRRQWKLPTSHKEENSWWPFLTIGPLCGDNENCPLHIRKKTHDDPSSLLALCAKTMETVHIRWGRKPMTTLLNRACHCSSHCWGYYPGNLLCILCNSSEDQSQTSTDFLCITKDMSNSALLRLCVEQPPAFFFFFSICHSGFCYTWPRFIHHSTCWWPSTQWC